MYLSRVKRPKGAEHVAHRLADTTGRELEAVCGLRASRLTYRLSERVPEGARVCGNCARFGEERK